MIMLFLLHMYNYPSKTVVSLD